ncbi:hypothetical protein [Chengkuizengella axinellae]|uniref:DUF1292 domain-containing protein n=1 Tax=Chengkuizengella axinellae TaxID=3064388 RepID=A0ABT9IYF3_9BACL|nr:hypothetical protein [Chengkuizengella sp. 2205SS18-9]MDP5274338.1 hypothetical protein [Chengkuizengella sp. 2205SS18-9]
MKHIYVKSVESFTVTNNVNGVVAEVKEGEEFKATLYEETEEYFTTDSKKRRVYVGAVDAEGVINIEDYFRLLPVSENKRS